MPGRSRGPVVQWLEPAAHNGVVAGSNPAGPTTFLRAFGSLLVPRAVFKDFGVVEGGLTVLRVTVTRESSAEIEPIGEVVIGDFAGTGGYGGYAAWIHEPPSPFSDGINAFFTVRSPERYQPTMALIASTLAAWREGRINEVDEDVRLALLNAAGPPPSPTKSALTIQELRETLAQIATGTGPRADAAAAAAELLGNVLFLAHGIIHAAPPPPP